MAELREHEAQLVEEKDAHLAQQKKSEDEFARCENEIKELREEEINLKAEMVKINGQLFYREEETQIIEMDKARVPNDGEGQINTGARTAWQERAKYLKSTK